MGRAKGSPTMTRRVTRSRSTTRHTSCGSKVRDSSSATVPPDSSMGIAPTHIPVPCMSGQHGMLTVWPARATAATNGAIPSTVVGTGSVRPSTANPLSSRSVKTPWSYITPFGIPVVPPV
jgi:hypothetical protein